MITQKDQLQLFEIISKNLTKDTTCYAFGGTAMMFYGYKDETKDIDLFFTEETARTAFINAIEQLNFQKTSALKIYIPEKLQSPGKPLMFKRDDFRIDLFAKSIFRTQLSPNMKEDLFAQHEFKERLTLKIVRKEQIVFLKSITERPADLIDIKTILEKTSDFDWEYLIEEAIWQHTHGDSWALMDLERALQQLKKEFFIEEKYLKRLYDAHK
ncbi:MAG: hypothetical protein OXR66_08435 [Candidatus Woesearchaeota archaeon]|nr:hypothetical protein [Candidatus Woesearchaeota archaeon]